MAQLMPAYDVVLFDLDGTLTDPQLGITKSIQYALARYDIAVDDLATLVPLIGPPLHTSFQQEYGFSEEQAFAAVDVYREYFTVTGIYENRVHPGIPVLLDALRRAGCTLVVATSKPTIFAERILEHFMLRHHFAAVVGSNLDGTRTAKAEVIRDALAAVPTHNERRSVMVGDREHDIIGAHDNHIDVVAVAYGYGSLDELQAAAPTAIVATIADLYEWLLR